MPKWASNAMCHEILALKINTSYKNYYLIAHVTIKIQMDENVQAYMYTSYIQYVICELSYAIKAKIIACATCNGKIIVHKIAKDRFSFNVFH
jgi:hypothetical protein